MRINSINIFIDNGKNIGVSSKGTPMIQNKQEFNI